MVGTFPPPPLSRCSALSRYSHSCYTAVGGCNFKQRILEKSWSRSLPNRSGDFHFPGSNTEEGGGAVQSLYAPERHFYGTREQSLTCGGSASRSTGKPGDLSAASAWVASNNPPIVWAWESKWSPPLFTRGGSGQRKKSSVQSWSELTLSPEQLAAGGDGEQQSGYVDTGAHLSGILKRIVDKKTEESWHAPWIHRQPPSLLSLLLSLSPSQSTDTPFSTSVSRMRTVAHMRKRGRTGTGVSGKVAVAKANILCSINLMMKSEWRNIVKKEDVKCILVMRELVNKQIDKIKLMRKKQNQQCTYC